MTLKLGLYGWRATHYHGWLKYVVEWSPDDRCYMGCAVDLRNREREWFALGLTVDECYSALRARAIGNA